MPSAEHGFKKAITGLVVGFVFSYALSLSLSATMGQEGGNLASMFNLFFMLIGLIQLERAKYWSLSYIVGYFGGLLLFGRYLLASWEFWPTLLLLGAYIMLKIWRKARGH